MIILKVFDYKYFIDYINSVLLYLLEAYQLVLAEGFLEDESKSFCF